jgi:membrane protease YdiL (CAAX protease family)
MVVDGSVRARRATLAGSGLGLRPTLLVSELLLVVPGLALVALVRVPLRGAFAPLPLPGRTVLLSLAAGLTLWGASLGLFSLQYLVWPPPDGYLEAFRQLHDALRPNGPADAFLSITAIALVPAVCEEALFRGIVFGSLNPALGAARAMFLQAFLFALIHIDLTPGGPPVAYRVPFAFGVGLALGALRLRTGSLAAPALSHALLNAFTFLVVLLADDPARETDPGPIVGLSLLLAGTAATLLVLRALPRAPAAPPAA